MQRALRLAARGIGRTNPNPAVGAVIVAGDQVVGEGYHQQAGGPHAEVFALEAAGAQAAGAAMYVTLEPCSHHGRTPPCVDAVIAAGIKRVVVAVQDPNPQVNGQGVAKLREAGITVEVGLCEKEARQLNAPFIKHIITGLPLVSLKAAMSLDGKIATRTGESQWITGEKARAYGHTLRAQHDAVMAGIGTVLADNPRLTARRENPTPYPPPRKQRGGTEERKAPLRIIVDSNARTPLNAALLTADSRPPVIAVAEGTPEERIEALQEAGAEVWVIAPHPLSTSPQARRGEIVGQELASCPATDWKGELMGQEASSCPTESRVDLNALMKRLGEQQIQSVLVEGGGTLASALLAAGLADRVYFFLAPIIIGGQAAPGPIGGDGIAKLAEVWRLTNLKVRRMGEDVLISGEIQDCRVGIPMSAVH
jgi:diaminohydroxyphosphoribosylaminopyrimidine deaminase/5-amino-6-(5-phosphoribosylamino)uracil reductase